MVASVPNRKEIPTMTDPVGLPCPLRPGDTADIHPTSPSHSLDETATPDQARDTAVDWSLDLPIGDDEMPA